MDLASSQSARDPREESGGTAAKGEAQAEDVLRKIERLPMGVGVLLMATGLTTGMLPPPPGPFDMTLILSGCLVLWPRGLRALARWAEKRSPTAHCASMGFLDRFLADLERRYPNSTRRRPETGPR